MLTVTIKTDQPEAELGLFDNNKQLGYVKWPAHRELAETIHSQLFGLLKKAGKDINQVDAYFLLDTQLGKQTQFQNYDALRHRALELGIEPNLQPINTVYSKFRFSWFDVFAGLLFCLPPLLGFLLLIRWIVRLRRTRPPLPHPA